MTDMTDLVTLFPRLPVPPLDVELADGGTFDVAAEKPASFTLVVFYRGLHCPICKTQLRELESKLDEFAFRPAVPRSSPVLQVEEIAG
jgi:peroxiredoxin